MCVCVYLYLHHMPNTLQLILYSFGITMDNFFIRKSFILYDYFTFFKKFYDVDIFKFFNESLEKLSWSRYCLECSRCSCSRIYIWFGFAKEYLTTSWCKQPFSGVPNCLVQSFHFRHKHKEISLFKFVKRSTILIL